MGSPSTPDLPAPYDVTKDPQYKEASDFLKKLRKDMVKNNTAMTPEQIIAALTPGQRDIIGQQTNPLPVRDMSSWSQFGNIAPSNSQTTIIPQVAPQPTGIFAGPQSASPELLSAITGLLGKGSLTGGK